MINFLREFSKPLGPDYWSGFKAASISEIKEIETQIQRKLPSDFVKFYSEIGFGSWPDPYNGDIYSPQEIILAVSAPIYFVLGSLTPDKEWASEEDHKKLWISKGVYNPDPQNFSKEVLFKENINLLNLLQIGTNGQCGYHQLILESNNNEGYLLINDSQEFEDIEKTFSEGIKKIIKRHLEYL